MSMRVEFIFKVEMLESTSTDIGYKIYGPIRKYTNAIIQWFTDIVALNTCFHNFTISFLSESLLFKASFESTTSKSCLDLLELLLNFRNNVIREIDIQDVTQTVHEDKTVTNSVTIHTYQIICTLISTHLSPVEEILSLPSLDVH